MRSPLRRSLRLLLPPLALALASCESKPAEPVDTAPVCDAVATGTSPEDGEDVIGTNATVRVGFEGQLSEAGAALTLSPEAAVVATLGEGEVAFSPEGALEANTTYTWSASLCGGAPLTGSFTTRSEGETMEADALIGRTFGVDLTQATWLEPEGGADLFSQLFGGLLLIGVEDIAEGQLSAMGAVGEDLSGVRQQDPCYATVDFDAADFTRNPYLELGPVEFPIEVQGQELILHDLHLLGAFADGGAALTDATLAAQGDLRDLAGPSYAGLCSQLAQFGLSCTTCVSDGEPACIDLLVTDIVGSRIPGLQLQTVTNPGAECGNDTGREG